MPKSASNPERIYEDCARSFNRGTAPFDRLRGRAILVTGGSGFVGSWLLSMLAYLNDVHGFGTRVTAVSRHPSRIDERAAFLAQRADIEWVATDIRQFVALPEDLAWIIHTAGIPDSRHHATDPIETASVIGEGTLRLFRLAERATRLEGILSFSSGLVDTALTQHRIMGPTAAYVEAKRFGEALCYAFRTQAKLPIIITRPFTFLGPFQRLDSPWAANNFLHAALEGQPLKIRGDGRAVRSYLYGSDMAVLALAQMVGGDSGEVFDLGGDEALSVGELAQLVVAQVGRPLDVRLNTANRGVAEDRFVPDLQRSIDRFGIMPAFSVAQAITRSLAWYAN